MIGRWKVFNLRVIIVCCVFNGELKFASPLCVFLKSGITSIYHIGHAPETCSFTESHWVDFMTPCPNQNSAVSVTDLPPLIQLFPFFSFFQQWLVLHEMHQLSACCIVILLALGGFIVSRGTTLPCSPPKDVSSTSLISLAWFRHGSFFKYWHIKMVSLFCN